MGKHIGTGGLAWGKILGRLAFYTWVDNIEENVSSEFLHIHSCVDAIRLCVCYITGIKPSLSLSQVPNHGLKRYAMPLLIFDQLMFLTFTCFCSISSSF